MNKKKLVAIIILVAMCVTILVVVLAAGNNDQSAINKSGYEVSSSSSGTSAPWYRDTDGAEIRLRELSFSGVVDENNSDAYTGDNPVLYPGYMLTVDWIRNDFSKGFLLKNTNNFENDTYGFNQSTMVSVDESMTAKVKEFNVAENDVGSLRTSILSEASFADYLIYDSEEIPVHTPYTIEEGVVDYEHYTHDVSYNTLKTEDAILICDCTFNTSLGTSRLMQWYDYGSELYHIVCIQPYADGTRLFTIEVESADSTNLLNAIIDITNDAIVVLGGS